MSDNTHDPVTGEVTEDLPVTRAANGDVIPAPTRSAGMFLDMLEDGAFSAEVHEQLQDLARQIRAISEATNCKAKGKAVVTFDLEYEGEAFAIRGDIKVKAPDLPRRKSVAWLDDSDCFTRFPPKQTQMFGTRGAVRAV